MVLLKQAIGDILVRSQQQKLIGYWTNRLSVQTGDSIEDISTAFKILLGSFPVDTLEICTHLDPTMDQQSWLAHFEVVVLPVLIQNQDLL